MPDELNRAPPTAQARAQGGGQQHDWVGYLRGGKDISGPATVDIKLPPTYALAAAQRVIVCLAVLLGPHATAHAQATAVGVWRTIDDSSGKPKALVRIVEKDGVLSRRIEKLFDPDPRWNGLWERCRDARKDQPVLGMTILTGLRSAGDEYRGGEILDPENGNVYRCRVKLIDNGKSLEVRGYIGAPLFGRTQVWTREK